MHEDRLDAVGEPGAGQQRAQLAGAPVDEDRRHAPRRQIGQRRQRRGEEVNLPPAGRAHQKHGGQIAMIAHRLDERGAPGRVEPLQKRAQRRLLAVAHEMVGHIGTGRGPHERADRQGLAGRLHQPVAKPRRQVGAVEQRTAQIGAGGKPGDQAPKAGRTQARIGVADQDERRLRRPVAAQHHRQRAGDLRPARDQALQAGRRGARPFDQVVVVDQRRARDHDRGDVDLVAHQRRHDLRRGMGAGRQRLGEGEAHLRRGIVQKQGQRRFRRHPFVHVETGVQVGARQRGCRSGTPRDVGAGLPFEEMFYDQWPMPLFRMLGGTLGTKGLRSVHHVR